MVVTCYCSRLPRSKRLYIDVILADLIVQCLATYAKNGSGLTDVTAGAFQGLLDLQLIDGRKVIFQ